MAGVRTMALTKCMNLLPKSTFKAPIGIGFSQRWFSNDAPTMTKKGKEKITRELYANPLFDVDVPLEELRLHDVFIKDDFDSLDQDGIPVWHKVIDEMLLQEEEEVKLKSKGPPPQVIQRVPKVDEKGRAYATGRRKTSSARVWISKSQGDGKITVNRREFVDYFCTDLHRKDVLKPFVSVSAIGDYDVWCTVKGGGVSGQAGAIRHGISRALQNFDPAMRPPLKKDGLLTRDPRMVERKKPGQPKARKKFQWVKR